MNVLKLKNLLIRAAYLIETAFYWCIEGIGIALPAGWKNRFQKYPFKLSYTAFNENRTGQLLKRNIFGDSIVEDTVFSTQDTYPVIEIFIPESMVYFDYVNIPRAAAKNIKQALDLRLEEISPFPIPETIFAWRHPGKSGNRLHVPVAIVKKSVFAKVMQQLPKHKRMLSIKTVNKSISDSHFIFNNEIRFPIRKPDIPVILRAGAVIAVIGVILAGLIRLDNSIDALENHQNSLILKIKAIQAEKNALTRSSVLVKKIQAESRLDDLVSILEALDAGITDDFHAGEITIKKTHAIMTGYIKQDSTESLFAGERNFSIVSRNPSEYPGFDSINFIVQASVRKRDDD